MYKDVYGLALGTNVLGVIGKVTFPTPKKSRTQKYTGLRASKKCCPGLIECTLIKKLLC
jgi:hypothetical protein